MPLHIIRQDITKIKCDAIVNPTNELLFPGGGTDAAVHAAAGEELTHECAKTEWCPQGKVRVTKGYKLPCRFIFHTVGPRWNGGTNNEEQLLESCYETCLEKATELHLKSLAFPLISSGTYRYPKDKVLKTAIKVISDYLMTHEMTVYIVVFDKKSYEFSKRLFDEITAYIDDAYAALPFFMRPAITGGMPRTSDGVHERRVAPSSDDADFPKCDAAPPSDNVDFSVCDAASYTPKCAPMMRNTKTTETSPISLSEWMEKMASDESFARMLFRLIDEKGISDVECYKKANVDKKTFSKIKCNKKYRPAKTTALAFAIALELDIDETKKLLQTVGYSLSRTNKADLIIEYFVTRGIYNIFEINEALFEFDQVCLGTTY